MPDLRFQPSPATRTDIPRPKRGEGQWALGYTEPLNGNEQQKKDDDPLNVRERIVKLVDPDSFHEIGKIAGRATYDESNDLAGFTPSNFVFGRARVDGRPVVVGGDDFTVRGGSADATITEKHLQCELMANQLRVPLLRLVEGSGGGGSVKTIETTGEFQSHWKLARKPPLPENEIRMISMNGTTKKIANSRISCAASSGAIHCFRITAAGSARCAQASSQAAQRSVSFGRCSLQYSGLKVNWTLTLSG